MNKIPDGALLQKSKNNVSYVYFPSYYYDKDAKTAKSNLFRAGFQSFRAA